MRKRRMRDRLGPPATFIAPGTVLRGQIQGEGHVLVAGQVIGDADIEGALTLAEGGAWEGAIRADDVVLAGMLEGELLARDRVEITAPARVRGRVIAGAIAISQGAVVEAELQSLGRQELVSFDERRRK